MKLDDQYFLSIENSHLKKNSTSDQTKKIIGRGTEGSSKIVHSRLRSILIDCRSLASNHIRVAQGSSISELVRKSVEHGLLRFTAATGAAHSDPVTENVFLELLERYGQGNKSPSMVAGGTKADQNLHCPRWSRSHARITMIRLGF